MRIYRPVVRALALALACAALPLQAKAQTGFSAWLDDSVRPAARKAGVSDATFARATKGLTPDMSLPDLGKPSAKPLRQTEFGAPARYFNENNINGLVAAGRERLKRHADTLAAIEQRYGVPRGIIVAIWGRESNYGQVAIPHNAIRALATQAYAGARKKAFFPELIAALQILEQGHVAPDRMKSSWAGALGQPQFLPSKFFSHAVDFDGDGRRDIWDSVPDTLASIAHYLAKHGWQQGRDWGFEAAIPQNISCTLEGPDQGRPIADFVAMGATRISGKPFPGHEVNRTGHLLMPAGRNGPAFIATPNFYVLKTYNESDLYALFIGHLADRLVYGNKPFVQRWGRVEGFSRGAVAEMQQRLERLGHDVGGADGLVGYKTRTSVGRWQEARGESATCFPDAGLVTSIR